MNEGNPASLVGRRLSDYQILRKLGRGGMADVYAARHLSLGRDVALKILRRDLACDKDYVDRFRREARAAAKLSHPNIVAVYDVGSAEGFHFIGQELIDGENLRESLDRTGPISGDEAISILMSVSSALEVAAEAGITHRDIKPENVMRSSRGVVKVADFGLARLAAGGDETSANLTQAGLTLGTPRYMSPEQVQGKPVDIRSDLYSLGVSIYHLLAGKAPFEAEEPLALAVMHLHETPEPLDRARNIRNESGDPDLPEWLIDVVDRLMAKLPDDRFQTPSQVIEAICDQAASGVVSGMPDSLASATIRLQRLADNAKNKRHRKYLHRIAAIALPLAVGIASNRWINAIRPGGDIKSILKPAEVAEATSVQQQYLIAATRNDEAAWQSVSRYFPADVNPTNARYYAKSMLQLTRLKIETKQWVAADRLLERLLSDPKIEKIYQVFALVLRCQLDERAGTELVAKPNRLQESKAQLKAMVQDVTRNNPAAIELLRRTVDPKDRIRFGIDS